MYFVYVLRSNADKKFYIGYTENIENRVCDHKAGRVFSTKDRLPLELIYYEAYLNQYDAQGREQFLKSGSGHRFLRKQLRHYLTGSEEVKIPLTVPTTMSLFKNNSRGGAAR